MLNARRVLKRSQPQQGERGPAHWQGSPQNVQALAVGHAVCKVRYTEPRAVGKNLSVLQKVPIYMLCEGIWYCTTAARVRSNLNVAHKVQQANVMFQVIVQVCPRAGLSARCFATEGCPRRVLWQAAGKRGKFHVAESGKPWWFAGQVEPVGNRTNWRRHGSRWQQVKGGGGRRGSRWYSPVGVNWR